LDKKVDRIEAKIDPKKTLSKQIFIKNGFIFREFKDFDGLQGEILN
jgi:hypothetical protein